MEDVFTVLSIVMLIFGILQIILFFKVWGMTNDVRWAKRHLEEPKTSERELMKAIQISDSNIERLLFNYSYSIFYEVYCECKENGESSNELSSVLSDNKENEYFAAALKKVAIAYDKAGVPVHKVFSEITSCKDFDTYFSLPKE